MADVNANIGVNIDTSNALAQLKSLQRQISQFHTSVARSSETAALAQRDLQRNFINSVNAISGFSAELRTVKTTAESFTDSLEKNKFSMREYFRYAGASTKTFGKLFRSEFDTINKVAEERVKRLQTQYIKMGRDATGAMKAIAIMPTSLDMKDFGTQVQIAAQRQALFNQLMKQGSTNLLNFGKNTQWAGRQLMVGFTLPLAALGTTAARTFMEMEAAALKFRKVYGDLFTPAAETKQALDNITEIGEQFTKYGIAVSQTVGLAAEAAAAGFQGLDLQRQTIEATRLQVLGQIDQQKALETTISLQNAFRMSSEDLAAAINFLNAVENQTVVSLDDITTAIPKAAPIVRELGGDVKDLAFFMAAMKEGGINASEGANALKSGLASLINPTEKASDMLAGFGININQIVEKNVGNVKQTVIDFALALDNLSDLNRQRAIEQLFGKFQQARLSALFDNVIRDGNQASRVLELTGASVEELSALAEQELGMTAESAMNKFRKAVEDLKLTLVPVGQTFLEAVTPIVDFIGGILDKFNNLSSGAKKAITLLTVAVGAIGPVLLMTFGLVANGIANLVKGFMVLRNGYLRLTGQSQILGEQTEYLTVEQQNAAAVAASLDQAHSRLTQTFNVEAGALKKLTAEYLAAISAGQRFAMNFPGAMIPQPGRRYNNGVVMVPGTGNKDTVPAMLTPGEAVIPAEMAKKYAPLIQGMIAGNIPGYKKGVPGDADFAHITNRQIVEIGKLLEMLEQAPKTMSQSMMATLRELAKVFGNELKTFVYSGLGFTQSKALNIGMAGDKPVMATEFLSDFQKQGMEKWNKSLNIAGVKIDDVSSELTLYDSKLQEAVQSLISFDENATITSTQFAAIEKEVRSTLPEFSQLRQALNMAEAAFTEIRFNINESQAIAAGMQPYQVPSQKFPGQMSKKKKINLPSGKAIRLGGEHFVGRGYGGMTGGINVSSIAASQGAQVANEAVLATAQAAGTQSPSRRTIPIGEDIARGLQVGMINQTDETVAVAENLGTQAVSGTQSGGRRRRIARRPQGAPEEIPMSQIQEQSALSESIKRVGDEQVRQGRLNAERLSKMNAGLMSATFAISSLSGITTLFADGPLAKFSGAISKLTGLMFVLMSVTQALTQTKILELAQSRIGYAAGAVISAKEAGIGMAARAGFIGNLAKAGLFLKTFLGPVGIATTVIGLMAGAIKLNNMRLEEQRKQLEAFSDVLAKTTKQSDFLSDYFGLIPQKGSLENFGEELERLSAVQRSEREKLKQDKGFQEAFGGTIGAVSRLSDEEAKSALTLKGLELISQGMAKEKVQELIAAIKEEAGKTNVKLDFANLKFDEAGIKQLNGEVGNALKGFQTTYISGLQKTFKYVAEGEGRSAQIKLVEALVPTEQAKAALKNAGTAVSSYIESINRLADSGSLNLDQYNKMFDGLFNTIKSSVPDSATQLALFRKAVKLIDPDLAKVIKGVNDLSQAQLILKGATAGVSEALLVNYAVALRTADALNKVADANIAAGAAADASAEAAYRRGTANAAVVDYEIKIRKAIEEALRISKELNKVDTANSNSKKGFLQDEITALKNQIAAYRQLRIAKVDAATASELAGNAEMAALLKTKAGVQQNIAAIKEYARLKREAALIQEAGAEIGDATIADLNRKKAFLDLQEQLITMRYSHELERQNRALEDQEWALEQVQRKIDQIEREQIRPLQDIIEENTFALEAIGFAEEKINAKYDEQERILENILEINQDIENVQRARLTVADALTTGDISAAAKAVEDLRSQQRNMASSNQRKVLQNARKQEIAALGRIEIEEANKKIQLEISKIQFEQTRNLEKQKVVIQDNIDGIQETIQNIEYVTMVSIRRMTDEISKRFGGTKVEIENALKVLDLSKAAGIDINSESFITNVLKAAGGYASYINKIITDTPDLFQAVIDEIAKLRAEMELPVIPKIDTAPINEQYLAPKLEVSLPIMKPDSSCPSGWAYYIETYVDEGQGQPATLFSSIPQPQPQPQPQPIPAGPCGPAKPYYNYYTGECVATPEEIKPRVTTVPTPTPTPKPTPIPTPTPEVSTVTPRPENIFTPFVEAAKNDYDKIVASSLKPGATPSDFGHALAAADKKVIDAINLVDERNKYNNIVASSLKPGATPSDFAASLAAQDKKVVDAAKKVTGTTSSTKKPAPSTIGGVTSSVVANFLAERKASGGIITQRYAFGGKVLGTDTVPAMLTPGEFVMSRYAVQNYGVDRMKAINDGTYAGDAVYNYSVNVNVKSGANPDEIARAVMTQIKQVDSQRIRTQRV